MSNPILVTVAAGRVGGVGRTVSELLLKQGKAVRAMVRNDDERARVSRDFGGGWWSAICSIPIRCTG